MCSIGGFIVCMFSSVVREGAPRVSKKSRASKTRDRIASGCIGLLASSDMFHSRGFPDFHPLSLVAATPTFLCNALLKTSRFLFSCTLQLLCSRHWTVLVFDFCWCCSFSDRGSQNDTRAGVHVYGTGTNECISNPYMVSAGSC